MGTTGVEVKVGESTVERRSADVDGCIVLLLLFTVTDSSIGSSVDDIITESCTDDVVIISTDDMTTGGGLLSVTETVWTTTTGEDSRTGTAVEVGRISTTPVETKWKESRYICTLIMYEAI